MKDNRARFGKIKIKDLMIIWILVTLGVIVMLFETFHACVPGRRAPEVGDGKEHALP